jgi:hypothetical protein
MYMVHGQLPGSKYHEDALYTYQRAFDIVIGCDSFDLNSGID